jgi:methylenetetrahydrofolate dehydrogenase (NADP+)/methenyltetrahydrofolate cyclohydrolase
MKFLNGSELAGFIKERQAKQVRSLRQSKKIAPKLAIVTCGTDPSIEKYVSLKQKYGNDILVDVEIFNETIDSIEQKINELNSDQSIHGIIIQLPISDPEKTEEIVNLVDPKKDVDSLSANGAFDAATPMAILWLLSGYNIQLIGKQIVIVGRGRLVGAPLEKMLLNSGISPKVIDSTTSNPQDIFASSDIIITAVGKAGLITSDMIPLNAVVVDAGVAGESGVLKGDLADEVYETRDDLTITPTKGGVGPLTVCALFENVIRSASGIYE